MVDLPIPQEPLTTAEAPQPKISPFVTARAGEGLAHGLESVGAGLEDIATPLAQQAGTAAGEQAVTRNPDGTMNIATPGNSFIMGRAGEAYDKAMTDAARVGVRSNVEMDMANIAQQHAGDPAAFLTAANQYSETLKANHPGQLGADGYAYAQSVGAQHYDGLVDSNAKRDTAQSFDALKARRELLANQMDGLAFQGGSGTPEFQRMNNEYQDISGSMAANHLFPYSADMRGVDADSLHERIGLSVVAGEARRVYESTGNLAGAQQYFDNETAKLNVEPSKLMAYRGEITRQMQGADAVAQQNRQALTDQAGATEKIWLGNNSVNDAERIDLSNKLVANKAYAAAAHLDGTAIAIKAMPSLTGGIGTGQQAVDSLRAIYGKATGTDAASNPIVTVSPTDRDTLIRTVAAEAGGEDDKGQAGVLHVIKTRMISGNYGQGVQGVVNPGNFMGVDPNNPANHLYRDIKPGSPEYEKIGKTVDGVMSGQIPDPTNGADHYYNPRDATPKWGPGLGARNSTMIGNHLFVGGSPDQTQAHEAFKVAVGLTQQAFDNHATTLLAGMEKAWDHPGEPWEPTAAEYSDLNTMAPYIKDGPLKTKIQQRLQTAQGTDAFNKNPLDVQQSVTSTLNILAAKGGLDPASRDVLTSVESNVKANEQLAKTDGVTLAQKVLPKEATAQYGPVEALDWSNTQSLPAALKTRGDYLSAVQKANPSVADNQLTQTDRQSLAATLPQMDGQHAGAVLSALQQNLSPQRLGALLGDKNVKESVEALGRSADPGKMNAAFSFMDSMQRSNPAQFKAAFGDSPELTRWQVGLAGHSPEEQAKIVNGWNDPAQAAGRKKSDEMADEKLKTITPDGVVSKLSQASILGLPSWVPGGTTAQAPISADNAVSAKMAMWSDYANAFKEEMRFSNDPKIADVQATKTVANKYGMSPTNGNAVMAYPPERSYQQVGGSFDWLGTQLDRFVAQRIPSAGNTQVDAEPWLTAGSELPHALNPDRSPSPVPRWLVSDDKTQADISANNPPSYQVVVQLPDGQHMAVMEPDGRTTRFWFDQDGAQAEHDVPQEYSKAVETAIELQADKAHVAKEAAKAARRGENQ